MDKNAMTSILGIHLCVFGVGALLLGYKAVGFGRRLAGSSTSRYRWIRCTVENEPGLKSGHFLGKPSRVMSWLLNESKAFG